MNSARFGRISPDEITCHRVTDDISGNLLEKVRNKNEVRISSFKSDLIGPKPS
jgi:hypothetical protein